MSRMSIVCAFVAAFGVMFPQMLLGQDKVMVNDPMAEPRSTASFTEIVVSGSIDLYLSPDDKDLVVVSARTKEFRDRIVTRVVGNKLEIYFNGKGGSFGTDMKLKAYVGFRQLKSITAGGASDVFVNGLVKSERLLIDIHGSSDFNGAVDAGKLQLKQSGSSDSKISGRVEEVEVNLSGASDMKAFDLTAQVCRINASGSSEVQVTVMKELYVNASGASDVLYKGTGTVREARTSGASSIKLAKD